MKKVKKMVVDGCNHNLNDENNTLRILPKKVMTTPPTLICVCEKCNKGFKFIQNEDGEYIEG